MLTLRFGWKLPKEKGTKEKRLEAKFSKTEENLWGGKCGLCA